MVQDAFVVRAEGVGLLLRAVDRVRRRRVLDRGGCEGAPGLVAERLRERTRRASCEHRPPHFQESCVT